MNACTPVTHHFKTLDDISGVVASVTARFPDLAACELGITELMLNAIEHGNLEISFANKGQLVEDGTIMDEMEARFQRSPYKERRARIDVSEGIDDVTVTVVDEGPGFDWQAYLQKDLRDVTGFHGRGILLSKATFLSLHYEGNGNTAIAVFRKTCD